MRFPSKFQLNSRNVESLQSEGFLTPEIFSLLNTNEWSNFILANPEDSKSSNFRNFIQSMRQKQNAFQFLSEKMTEDMIDTNDGLKTMISELDDILDSGAFRSGEISVIFGKFRSGKTQLLHQLAISAYISSLKKVEFEKKIIFIDTENTFRPDRIVQMANYRKFDPTEILESIYHISCPNFDALEISINSIENLFQSQKISTVLIDSLTDPIRLMHSSDSISSFQKQSKIIRILKKLKKIAGNYQIPVICSSQISEIFEKERFLTIKPVALTYLVLFSKQMVLLGEFWEYIENGQGYRFARCFNSQSTPGNQVKIRITAGGVLGETEGYLYPSE